MTKTVSTKRFKDEDFKCNKYSPIKYVIYSTITKTSAADDMNTFSDVCFRYALEKIRKFYAHSIMFHSKYDEVEPDALPIEIINKWFRYSIENKALPNCVVPPEEHNTNFVINLDKDIPPSLLYLYLWVIRAPQDSPNTVDTTIKLIEEYGFDYMTAFMVMAGYCLDTFNRIIPPLRPLYTDRTPLLRINNIPLHFINALKLFLTDPKKYDDRSVYLQDSEFEFNNTIDKMVEKEEYVSMIKLLESY